MSNKQKTFWPPERTAKHSGCHRRLQEHGMLEIATETSYRVGSEKDRTTEEPVI